MNKHLKAAAASFARVLSAAAVAAYLAQGKTDLSTWTWDDVQTFGWATASAAVLTLVNWLRAGETRYGRHAAGG
ncbi:MAG: hypothetical protein ACOYY2_13000 [Actinomycetota bacterium]